MIARCTQLLVPNVCPSLPRAVFDPRATASIVLSFLTRGALSTSVDGDGQQLGATYVLERGTGRVLYAHRQAHTGDEPDGAQIVRAVARARGDHRYIFERHLSTTEQHRWRTKVVSSDALLVRLRGTGVHEVRLVAPPGALKKVHLD